MVSVTVLTHTISLKMNHYLYIFIKLFICGGGVGAEGVIPIHRTELWKLKLDFSNQSVRDLEGDFDHKTIIQ